MNELEIITFLLRAPAGYCVDLFGGLLDVRQLENGAFEVCSRDARGTQPPHIESFEDASDAAQRFLVLRAERRLGFDFEAEEMAAYEDVDDFPSKMWLPPFVDRFDTGQVSELGDPINLAMLALALSTEVEMGGLVTYLGNSVGKYALATVDALRLLDRHDDADRLDAALRIASSAGMSHERIQGERAEVPAFTVVTFGALHGKKWETAAARIEALGDFDHEGIRDAVAAWLRLHDRASTIP